MDTLIFSPISLSDIQAALRQIVKEEISEREKKDSMDTLLSPEEARKLFKPSISRGTLHNWTKEGILTSHPIGGRVWYKYSDILQALGKIKKYSRSESQAA